MSTSEARALPYFTDLLGLALESGKIYIGQAGLDPMAYPQTLYSDAASTIALAQPVRTQHGHAISGGAYVHVYCTAPYSITVMDASGRVVYTSLRENDPSLTSISSQYVQSAVSLAQLRTFSGPSTNQVYVTFYGLYYYDSLDTTSPEVIPRVIVGLDGSRYKLSPTYAIGPFLEATNPASPNSAGSYLSWNDGGDYASYITNNQGPGTGGIVLRTVNANNSVENGRVTFTPGGGIIAQSDIRSNGNMISQGGSLFLNSAATRALNFDSVGGVYNLVGAPLSINGSNTVVEANFPNLLNAQAPGVIANIMNNRLVGAVTLSTSTMPTPGTWSLQSSINGVYLWVRVA